MKLILLSPKLSSAPALTFLPQPPPTLNLYKTCSKSASKYTGNIQTYVQKRCIKISAKGKANQNSDTDVAAYIAEAIERAESKRRLLSSATKPAPGQ